MLDEFPDNPTYNELIKFLKNRGFEEEVVTSDDLFKEPIYEIIKRLMSSNTTPMFISLDVNGKYHAVRFFNTGNTKDEHPIFLYRVNDTGMYNGPTIEYINKAPTAKPIKIEDFIQMVNSYFEWD